LLTIERKAWELRGSLECFFPDGCGQQLHEWFFDDFVATHTNAAIIALRA